MRLFIDTEFIEDGRTIDLISIGIVAEDGRTYYAESAEFDESKASEWVVKNVFPYLGPKEGRKSRQQIRDEIFSFAGEWPEIWAYFADYDWVALCQLFGRMIDLPKNWPFYCRDLKQEMDRTGIKRKELPDCEAEHNALADARWVRDAYEIVNGRES
jgi:hypothetical protein